MKINDVLSCKLKYIDVLQHAVPSKLYVSVNHDTYHNINRNAIIMIGNNIKLSFLQKRTDLSTKRLVVDNETPHIKYLLVHWIRDWR